MIAPLTILDTFSRSVSSGWGTSDSGHIWSSTSGTSVGDRAGNLSSPAGSGLSYSYVNFTTAANSIPEQESCETLVRFQYTGNDLYPTTDFGPILQKQSGVETFYYASMQGNYGEIAVGVYINSYRYEITRQSFPFSKNIWYWTRFRRSGSNLYVRVWREGTAEPSSWTIITTVWTGSNPPRAGSCGFYKRGTTSTYNVRVANYYFYTLEDDYSSEVVGDTWNRTVNEGWGWSDSGHPWEGHMSVDPYGLTLPKQGSTNTNLGGSGFMPTSNAGSRVGFLGASKAGDLEILAKLSINTSSPATFAKVGLRGRLQQSSGGFLGYGYAAQIQSGSNVVQIVRRNTAGGTTSAIASGTMPTAVSANTIYALRFSIQGQLLRLRVWVNGTTEPTTWQATVTDATFTTGRVWLEGTQTDGNTRVITFYQISLGPPTTDVPTAQNYTVTGALSLTSSSDTALTLRATYTSDENSNNAITVQYKKSTSSAWSTWSGSKTVNRSTKQWTIPVTGLTYKTAYDFRVTFTDNEDVHGKNPLTATYTTSGNSITTKAITVSNITSTGAYVKATYTDDADSNATATLATRVTSREQVVIEDTFDDDYGVYLQNHIANNGATWAKHPNNTPSVQAIIDNARVVAATNVETDLVLYYANVSTPSAEYDVIADFYTADLNPTVMLLGRLSNTTTTAYGVGYNPTDGQWELRRIDNGLTVVLESFPQELDTTTIYTVRLVLRDAYKSVEIDGEEIMRSDDNTITAKGYGGYYVTNLISGSSVNHILLDNFKITYRLPAGPWTTFGTMLRNTTEKYFYRSMVGLVSDTVYDFRVTFSDTTAVKGSNPLIATGMTIGKAVSLKALGIATQPTAAIVDVLFDYDINNNSSISIQYRSIRNTLWTTVNNSDIVATRDTSVKRFTTTLANLRAATTYELKAVVDDPDGLIEGSSREVRGLFTTDGLQVGQTLRTKNYLWKVYNPKDQYIGTLTDVPDPDYNLDENGGNADINVTLFRRISDVGRGANPLVAHQNRVDIWVLDPSSNGLGPNILDNPQMDASGGWTLGPGAAYDDRGGPDGNSALRFVHGTSNEYETISNPIELRAVVPLTFRAICKASTTKLAMYAKAYDTHDLQIDQSTEIAETVGTSWQQLQITYTPPPNTAYVRMVFRNRGKGTMYADMAEVRVKEMMIYRGKIESYTPKFDENGENISIELLGLISQLSDDYIEHLQYVRTQSTEDAEQKKVNRGPADPATIIKDVIDYARKSNPRCQLYYTATSINATGQLVEYTFRDQQLRAIFDKVREMCPPNWHYFVEPDGLVQLRGPQHVTTHILKSNVHIQTLEVERSIRNLKNYIRVKGRQDPKKEEPDGFGSIAYTAFDQESVNKYGKRVMFINDSQIVTPDIAELYGDGRLEEMNREEQRATAVVPDDKSLVNADSTLIGYNIEAFRPGDLIRIYDPIGGPRNTYWDQFIWDEETWDISMQYLPLPDAVPIKSISISGNKATLQLSQRQPSAVSAYAKLTRWISKQDTGN